MWKSLRIRLMVIFIGLAVGPVLVVGAILAERTFSIEQTQAVNLQRQVAQRVAAEVDAYIAAVQNDLVLLGGDLRNQAQSDRAQQLSLLLSAINNGPYRDVYQELTLLDAQGHEEIRVSRLEIVAVGDLNDRAGADEFEQPKANGETYFSPVWLDETTGQPFFTVAIPLSELRSVELSGVLVADFRLEAIRRLIADLQISQDQTAYLLDSSSKVVVHHDPAFVSSDTAFVLPSADGHAEGLSGTDVIFATDSIQFGNLSLTVVAERPISVALELAQNGLYVSVVVTALALIVAVGLVTLTVWQIVRPIEKLSDVARSIQAGDLSARAEIKNRDEIGILAQSFNDMTSRLQDMIESLEDRVAERVRDLTLASEVSRQITTELDSARLIAHVAELTATAFNLNHVSIFLYEDADQTIQLRQGIGEIGKQMVREGKKFRLGDQGLVPLAARTQQAQASNDVELDPLHFRNPKLPETRSELAVPMLYRGKLIGVLDLQSRDVNRFREEDVRMMTTLAEQVAIAVRNAQLFTEAQSALETAERANAVKSAFLASMSHELRTPLNSVINFTKFVMKGVMGPVTEKQEETLGKVVGSAKHLLNLINDVLDISKIESGSLNLFVEENVDVTEILDTVKTIAESLLNEKTIELQVDIEPDLPLILGDRQRILQILLNVISNACKFTEEGQIKISAHQRNGMLEIGVRDSGPGIAPEDHDAVFEPFKQTDTGLREGTGTGLGMPISRSLAEAHGGRLWLESALGQGATFYLTLPVYSEKLKPVLATQPIALN